MAHRVRWTLEAVADLEEIADFIAKDSPRAADRLVRELRAASQSLSQFSERGRVIPELELPDLRELVLGSYRLLYRIETEQVWIVGILHGARDLLAHLRRPNRD